MAVAIVRDISCTRSAERFVLFSPFAAFVLIVLSNESIRLEMILIMSIYCKQNNTHKFLGVLGRRQFPLTQYVTENHESERHIL